MNDSGLDTLTRLRVRWHARRLKSRNIDIRVGAVDKLGELRRREGVQPLCYLLQSTTHPKTRKAIVAALHRISDPAAIPSLKLALLAEDLQDSVIHALEACGWQPSTDSERVLSLVANGRWRTLVDLGAVCVPTLLQIVEGEAGKNLYRHNATQLTKRWFHAAETLAKIASPPTLHFLISLLDRRFGNMHALAINGLRDIGDPAAIAPLLRLYEDSSHFDRKLACEALEHLGWRPESNAEKALYHVSKQEWLAAGALGEAAVEPLTCAIRCGHHSVEIAVALANTGSTSAVPPLATLACEPLAEEQARLIAIEGLKLFRTKASIAGLIAAMRGRGYCNHFDQWRVRIAAARALSSLGHECIEDDDRILMDILSDQLERLDHDDPRVMSVLVRALHQGYTPAAVILVKIGNELAISALVASLEVREAHDALVGIGVAATPALLTRLNSFVNGPIHYSSQNTVHHCLSVLALIRDLDAVPAIRRLTQNHETRWAAFGALASIDPAKWLPQIIDMCQDEQFLWQRASIAASIAATLRRSATFVSEDLLTRLEVLYIPAKEPVFTPIRGVRADFGPGGPPTVHAFDEDVEIGGDIRALAAKELASRRALA